MSYIIWKSNIDKVWVWADKEKQSAFLWDCKRSSRNGISGVLNRWSIHQQSTCPADVKDNFDHPNQHGHPSRDSSVKSKIQSIRLLDRITGESTADWTGGEWQSSSCGHLWGAPGQRGGLNQIFQIFITSSFAGFEERGFAEKQLSEHHWGHEQVDCKDFHVYKIYKAFFFFIFFFSLGHLIKSKPSICPNMS